MFKGILFRPLTYRRILIMNQQLYFNTSNSNETKNKSIHAKYNETNEHEERLLFVILINFSWNN